MIIFILFTPFILKGCNPALMTGFVEGMTKNLERQNYQRNIERKTYGMSQSKAINEVNETFTNIRNCADAQKSSFLMKYPEYAWVTARPESLSARDFADNTKISNSKEKNAIIEYDEVQMECFNSYIYDISSDNVIGQAILAPMQMTTTESLIITAKYVNGQITRGEARQSLVRVLNEFKSKKNEIKSKIQSRASRFQNEAILRKLQNENNRLASELSRSPPQVIKRYRPIFCHQYYAINTISCY